jgi:hypothetical protein
VVTSVSGCTLEDETVRLKVTDKIKIEPITNNTTSEGILNLTIYNNYSGTLKVNKKNFQIKGEDVTLKDTHPKLFILNLTIHENASETFGKGEVRKITIRHAQFPNVFLDELLYESGNVKLNVDLTKNSDVVVIVEPSIFKTNYFIFTMVFIASIVVLALVLGRKQPTPTVGKNLCQFCLNDLSKTGDKEKLFCDKWRTRTRRCGEGPFCSKRCLKYHQEDVPHEN